MKPSATDISLKYLGALTEAVRKKNASKYGKKPAIEVVEPDSMGVESELGEDDIAALMDGGESMSGEHEMGEQSAEEVDQAEMGEMSEAKSPTLALFKKKSKALTKG